MEDFFSKMLPLIGIGLGETIYLVGFTMLFTVIIGLPLGIILAITSDGHIMPKKNLNSILSYVVNMLRSFPFLILMVVLIPVTRFFMGTAIGNTAMIMPLTIGTVPFFARLIETSIKEVEWGVIEAAQSMGATNMQIIRKVLLPESLPSIISNITLTIITVIGSSAMVGTLGGGGLGNLAIVYGHQRYRYDVMIFIVILLIIIVQIIQSVGTKIALSFDKSR